MTLSAKIPATAVSKKLVLLAALATILAGAPGCGKQAFTVSKNTQEQQAPGSYVVPAKLDLLIVQSDAGKIGEIYSQVNAQMNSFLTSLQARGWDYHLATIPLTHSRSISQIQASVYDLNWGAQWQPRYPGMAQSEASQVLASVFRMPGDYSDFITPDQVSNADNGNEQGFSHILSTLQDSNTVNTGFFRKDSLLAIVVVSNGNDTSNVNICKRNDGYVGPCNETGAPVCTTANQANCDNSLQSFNTYKAAFQAATLSAYQVKMYAAVAANRFTQGGCAGSNSYAGIRYQQMAAALNGTSYDLCTLALGTVLDDLSAHLQNVKMNFRTRYLFIAQDADPATLVVTRHSNGTDSDIAQSATNGWTYAGLLSNVYAIDSPVPMNQTTGYAIELHGSAELSGSDTATVAFKPANAHDAASN